MFCGNLLWFCLGPNANNLGYSILKGLAAGVFE